MALKFCTQCGSKLAQADSFCPECGTALETAATVESAVPVPEFSPNASPSPTINITPIQKKPLPLWKKIALTASIVAAVALVGAHLTMKNLTAPEGKIEAFYNALINDDKETFFSELSLPKDVIYSPEAYMSYVKDQDMPLFLNHLQENALNVANDGLTRTIVHENEDELFRIQQTKTLGIYKSIIIEPITTLVKIEADLNEGKLVLENKEYSFEGKNIDLGLFLPGLYKVEVQSNNTYIPNNVPRDVKISTTEREHIFSFTKENSMIQLDGDFPDSLVYIDGKSTKKTIKELKELGPIFDDQEVTIHATKKTVNGEWAESYSETAQAGETVHLSFPYHEDFIEKTSEEIAAEFFDEDELSSFVKNFRSDYEDALNDQDFSYISPYLMEGSPAYSELKDFMGEYEDKAFHYDFTRDDVTDVSISSDQAIVSTNEKFVFTNHKGAVTHYDRTKEYTIKLFEDEYKIYSINILDTDKGGGN
ncbi:TcaA NTF2-like domain-containing protein [Lederbergia citrea]|uniref:TcaA NTF2-like domain-containing protein n=1 Tax=Lederbergia citrea TaxID=2833581 RepID=UPI001BC9F248|nr:zinc-ribbon domain-containing protein [Lederbergia citrea]MBS4204847.1 zinc-ribbon domain-containing protein [Lederbergia citrea]